MCAMYYLDTSGLPFCPIYLSRLLSFSLSLVHASYSRPRDRRCVVVVVATTVAARGHTKLHS